MIELESPDAGRRSMRHQVVVLTVGRLRAALSAALLAATLFMPSVMAAVVVSDEPSCDPSKASCVPTGSANECTPAKQAAGLCAPPPDGGGNEGGSCTAPPGGSPTCSGEGPASQGGGTGGVSVGGGNPINLISGNKFQEEIDLAPLPGVLGLEFKRYYNSLSAHAGLTGAGWRSSYETVLYDMGGQLQIVQADGRRLNFSRGPGQAGVTLCTSAQPDDGQVRIEGSRDGKGWRSYHWRWPDGRTLIFGGGSGGGYPLQAIVAPGGQKLVLSYGPRGELAQVRDPQGRQLNFIYGVGRMLQAIGTPLGRIRYVRDTGGRLVEAAYVASTGADAKSLAEGQAQLTRLYHYESQYNSGHPNALTGISVRGIDRRTGQVVQERISTYAYNAAGLAILSTKGQPKELREGKSVPDTGIEQIDVSYAMRPQPWEGKPDTHGEVQPVGLGKAVLTNSLGQKTEITSAIIGGYYRLIEMRGPGCSTCGPSDMRYAYNAGGQLVRKTRLDKNGKPLESELLRYDAHGRLVAMGRQAAPVGAKASPVVWIQQLEYQDLRYKDGSLALAPRPSMIEMPSIVPGKTHTMSMSYDADGLLTQITEQGYSPLDDRGQPLLEGRPLRRTMTYRYGDVAGHKVMLEIDGPLPNGPSASPADSDITRLRWNDDGSQIVAVTRPGGFIEEFGFDGAGRVVDRTLIDAAQRIRTHTDFGSQAGFASLAEAVTMTGWLHDAQGKPVASSQLSLVLQKSEFDALGRLVRSSDSAGREIRFSHDVAGRTTSIADGQGNTGRYERDTEGLLRRAGLFRPGQETPLRAAYYWYDDWGRLTQRLLPDGRTDRYRYDARGLLDEHLAGDGTLHTILRSPTLDAQADIEQTADGWVRARLQGAGPASAGKAFAADADVSAVRAGKSGTGDEQAMPAAKAELRDDFGRVAVRSLPDHGLKTFLHDEANRLVSEFEAGGSRNDYRYDIAGRLTHKTAQAPGREPEQSRWVYQGRQLREAVDPQQSSVYVLDALGRTVRETITLAGRHYDIGTGYGADGQVSSRALADGRVLRIDRGTPEQGAVAQKLLLQSANVAAVYDWLQTRIGPSWAQRIGQWLPAQLVASQIDVDAFDGLTHYAAGNGIGMEKRHDIAGRLSSLRIDKVASVQYRYGVGPRIRAIEPTADAPAQTAFQKALFDYEGFGALTREPARQQASTASERAPRDARGRTKQAGAQRYGYAIGGQLETVSDTEGRELARYAYNSRHERVAKTVSGRTTRYLWQASRLVAEIDEQGRITTQYLYLSEGQRAMPIAKLESAWNPDNAQLNERTLYIHNDHRGAPMAMSDEAGEVVWRAAESDPWGQPRAGLQKTAAGPRAVKAVLNLRLPGQYYDEETGLHDNLHRSYDPRTGRYLQPDPLGYPDGPDPYLYAGGDPVNRVDPMGLYEEDVHYYLVYFLARAAGLSKDQAYSLGLASQYVDDNPLTTPVVNDWPNTKALPLYHFTRTSADDTTSDPVTRINNPTSDQLKNLSNPAYDTRLASCTRTQFFGEYLHAFADTFSHRDESNSPFYLTSTLGHGLYNHDPDQTYNIREFQSNEMRTLRMAQEMFGKIQGFDGAPSYFSWTDIVDTVRAFIIVGKEDAVKANRWQDNCSKAGLFGEKCDVAAYEARKSAELDKKIQVLEGKLVQLKLQEPGDLTGKFRYDVDAASSQRTDNLAGLDHGPNSNGKKKFPGVLLPGD